MHIAWAPRLCSAAAAAGEYRRRDSRGGDPTIRGLAQRTPPVQPWQARPSVRSTQRVELLHCADGDRAAARPSASAGGGPGPHCPEPPLRCRAKRSLGQMPISLSTPYRHTDQGPKTLGDAVPLLAEPVREILFLQVGDGALGAGEVFAVRRQLDGRHKCLCRPWLRIKSILALKSTLGAVRLTPEVRPPGEMLPPLPTVPSARGMSSSARAAPKALQLEPPLPVARRRQQQAEEGAKCEPAVCLARRAHQLLGRGYPERRQLRGGGEENRARSPAKFRVFLL